MNGERAFTRADLARLDEPCAPGLLQATTRCPGAAASPVGVTVAGEPVWHSAPHDPAAEAVAARAVPGVSAVAFAVGTAPAAQEIGLALAVADHLREYRTGLLGVSRPCAVSPARPPRGDCDLVRLPHLISVDRGGLRQDAALWELLPAAEIEPWLGAPLPEGAALVEQHLGHLLRLRRAAYMGTLPRSGPHGMLRDLLARGRYFSIRFVYQHIDLFTDLLTPEDASV